MLTGFPRTRWPRRRFSESYAVRISVKISRIREFRVIMGIMTSLLGCCSSSTLGSRANDYVKTLATLGFWLHYSPCSLGCWTNNTLAARSLSPKHTPSLEKSCLNWPQAWDQCGALGPPWSEYLNGCPEVSGWPMSSFGMPKLNHGLQLLF